MAGAMDEPVRPAGVADHLPARPVHVGARDAGPTAATPAARRPGPPDRPSQVGVGDGIDPHRPGHVGAVPVEQGPEVDHDGAPRPRCAGSSAGGGVWLRLGPPATMARTKGRWRRAGPVARSAELQFVGRSASSGRTVSSAAVRDARRLGQSGQLAGILDPGAAPRRARPWGTSSDVGDQSSAKLCWRADVGGLQPELPR